MYQQSLVILKPDAIKRRFAGRIIQRFEDAGLKIQAIRFETISPEQSKQHYDEHVEKPFYPHLEKYITSGPSMILVLGGDGAISRIRTMVGNTIPGEAAPGTIRGDLAHQGNTALASQQQGRPVFNLIHASANASDADKEISGWFSQAQIEEYPFYDDYILGL